MLGFLSSLMGGSKTDLSLYKEAIGLDVRTLEEVQRNPAPQSVHIPLNKLTDEITKRVTDKNATLVVFCESGARSERARSVLMSMGYKNVVNIASWRAWNKLKA